jgi:hypothetical protein
VKNGIIKNAAVSTLLESARKIVGHFKHSNLASERLREIQKSENLPDHKLIQVFYLSIRNFN